MATDRPIIRKLLSLSALHLTPAQSLNMDRIADEVEYGWLMWAYDERCDDAISDELWAVCEFARKHGCDWIMFDDEGVVITGLPHFER